MSSRESLSNPIEEEFAARLEAVLRRTPRVVVAFSGGVDSAVVLAAAQRFCERVVAATAVSPSLAAGELQAARELATGLGVRHEVAATDEFSRPEYLQNSGDRCFHCKTELYEQLAARLTDWGCDAILNGTNRDDLGDYRPGLEAARRHGVLSPLVEAGLGKEDVRRLARVWGLAVWDKPAAPCLSSRIAYGVEATPERVARIDAAERFLRDRFGLRELRVRVEAGELARIEVATSEIAGLAAPGAREDVVRAFEGFGFRAVTLDLAGFRSGSLNALLPVSELRVIDR